MLPVAVSGRTARFDFFVIGQFMGVIYETIKRPNLWSYEPEYNEDGTEKHITQDSARYHVVSYFMRGNKLVVRCSCENCEFNKSR